MRETLRALGLTVGRMRSGATDTILDVPGFRVGHLSLVQGEGRLRVGEGPVRTGVTVVAPPGPPPWTAAVHVINGFGKTAGLMQVAELGTLEHPILLTNTLGVGAVLDGYLALVRDGVTGEAGSLRNVVVAECNDGFLNDLWGLHVRPHHVRAALMDLSDRELQQGAVGAGTGMAGFGHKGGIGSASRVLSSGHTIAALVLLICGRPEELIFRGVRILESGEERTPDGSIIMVLAADTGLDAWDLTRVARRATHGLARTGAVSAPGSGDVVIAVDVGEAGRTGDHRLGECFEATAEVVEAAVWNALLTAETMVGQDGHVLRALDVDRVLRAAGSV